MKKTWQELLDLKRLERRSSCFTKSLCRSGGWCIVLNVVPMALYSGLPKKDKRQGNRVVNSPGFWHLFMCIDYLHYRPKPASRVIAYSSSDWNVFIKVWSMSRRERKKVGRARAKTREQDSSSCTLQFFLSRLLSPLAKLSKEKENYTWLYRFYLIRRFFNFLVETLIALQSCALSRWCTVTKICPEHVS